MASICLRPGLSKSTFVFSNKTIHCSPWPRDHLLNKEVECRNLAAHAFLHVFSFSLRRTCNVALSYIKKGKSGNNRTFCWFTTLQDWRSICCDRRWAWSDLRQITSRHIWALCRNEDKFPLWMFIFLFVNKDHLRAGKSLPLISVVPCDLSCLHLSKQNRNRNIFASKSQDKITN